MTAFKFILWFILTATVYGALFAAWIPLRKKDKRWISIVGIILEIILAFVCAYFIIAWDTILPRLPQCFLAMLYTALPAGFMTAVSVTYLLIADEGFMLDQTLSYIIGAAAAAVLLAIYLVAFIRINRSKSTL